jgi:predicted phage tail protein
MQDLKIKIHGVNVVEPAFEREMKISYKHYHLEITATNEQETNLKKRLLAGGLAIDIKPFDLTEYQEADQRQTNNIQNFLQSHYESAGTHKS